MTNRCSNHWIPYLCRNKRLKCLRQPCKLIMSIGNTENRAAHWNLNTLRNRDNLNRKITQLVQLTNLINVVNILTHCIIKYSLVLCNYLILWTIEEILIELINKPVLNKHLQTKVYNLWPTIYTALTWSVIRYRFSHTRIQHFTMNCLIKILK